MSNVKGQKASMGIYCLAAVFFLYTGIAQAVQAPQLELKTTAEKEVKVKKKGKIVLEKNPAEQAGPGDIVAYTITYLNTGKSAAVDAEIVDPIPRGVVIIPESAEGKDAEVMCSIDNGISWHKPPVMMKIKKSNETQSLKPAPADKYTHVKWVIKKPVMPGQSGQVSFKVTVK